MRFLLHKALFMVALVALPILVAAQGVTTASMYGRIIDGETGEPLIGATVQAIHTPSGSTYGNVTDIDGYYRIPGMRVGGPYTFKVSYTGYGEQVKEGTFLTLGQTFDYSPKMETGANELAEVLVSAGRGDIFNGEATGQETNISNEAINALPTVSRSVGDFTRLTPQSTTREGNDGFELSFAGINNRYNAFFIDGAVNNDVFGLAGSGFNGGQTGVSPISVDAIESFQINLAPFDVRQGGFGGASINAITRSGSNNFEASVYGFYRDQDFVRTDLEGAIVDDFTAYTAGFRLGGPIVKDKIFFFINYERQDETTPLPFDINDYRGDSDAGQLNALGDQLRREFGYEPGTFTDNERFLVSDKINAKFDFNLGTNNKIALRLSYVGADNLEGVQSNVGNIRFLNSSERFVAKTYGAALEWNSIIGSNMSNNLVVGATFQRDDRDPNGQIFPYVEIQDGGNGLIQFGSEQFSTANLLNQDVITITNNFEIFKGKHTYTIGANVEFYQADNLFIPFNYGSYEFSSLSDFVNGENSNFYIRSYSLRDNLIGDESAAIASFGAGQAGLYFQDRIQFSKDFSLTAGIRLDLPFYDDTPVNSQFNDEVIPIIEEVYDLQGARTGDFIKPQLQFSPRIGFNWDVKGDKSTQVRGGLGIFTSRAPLVWVGGAYNNNGLNRGTVLRFGDQPFIADPNAQPPGDIDPNDITPNGDIDIFAEDFRLPQFLKFSLSVDKKLPLGLIGTVDLIYNKTVYNVAYQNVNINPATDALEGADNRTYYGQGGRDLEGLSDAGLTRYGRVILGYNTNRGYGYNLTASLTKPFTNGFYVQASYSYGDAYSVFDGTSSQNSSQWRGLNNVYGRNIDQRVMRSDFAAGSRFLGVVSKRFAYGANKNWATTLTLVSETAQSAPYSLIINDPGVENAQGDDEFFQGRTDSRERSLAFLPQSAKDLVFVDDGDVSAARQQAAFQQFLDTYYDGNVPIGGRYAERNERFGPWATVVDLRFVQDIPIAGRNRLQITFDANNITNLINPNWGRRRFVFSQFEILDFAGFEEGTLVPTFNFDLDNIDEEGNINTDNLFDDAGIQSSRFQGQIGIRYIFE
ncbi:MAG: carboxypeptidase regulatory-like domain-containing protein [Bacteroidota bacterium]